MADEPRVDSGNPQESDEYTSGAEVGPVSGSTLQAPAKLVARSEGASTLLSPDAASQGDTARSHMTQSNVRVQSSESEDITPIAALGTRADMTLLDPLTRCAQLLALYSLVLQAIFQTDEALHQHSALASEEALRWQLVLLAQPMKSAADLPAVWRDRLAFHGLRLYLLICRSSHTRRQYVVLQKPFVEEERRTVAFLLSLTPPAQRCCVILRAMAQDVQSWLSWQSQAPPTTALGNRGLGAASARSHHPAAPGALPTRTRRRRSGGSASASAPHSGQHSSAHAEPEAHRTAHPRDSTHRSSRSTSKSAAAEGHHSTRKQGGADGRGRSRGDHMFDEDAANLARLFSSGESVWLVHLLLLLVFVAFAMTIWHSLERPRGTSTYWKSSFWS